MSARKPAGAEPCFLSLEFFPMIGYTVITSGHGPVPFLRQATAKVQRWSADVPGARRSEGAGAGKAAQRQANSPRLENALDETQTNPAVQESKRTRRNKGTHSARIDASAERTNPAAEGAKRMYGPPRLCKMISAGLNVGANVSGLCG
jgi:hypothetical protein